MTRLIWLAVLVAIACRMLIGKWPWTLLGLDTGAGRRARADLAAARGLLGVSAGASRKDIAEAHRRLVARVHPDRGGSAERVYEADAARDTLIDNLPSESRDERP